ncbi:facilitated trehalose transporter Tret1-like [Thrips palmi]|uniref:Facilitated trehalose transporter Tret1-like n=1 Tax=Thrips palmi TaxID=161013 RepID=A0A6P8YJB6_THRPL|nr:facilitated trehalose transporter Tret1-like [Thrips palmi]
MPVPPAQMNPATRLVQGPGKILLEENSRTALTIVTTTTEARKVPQFLAAFTATLGALCAGTYFSWSASVSADLVQKGNNATANANATEDDGQAMLSLEHFSWVVSMLMIGACGGSLVAGMAANRLGRQRTLVLLSVPMVVSWLLMSATASATCLLLGRALGGISIGAVSVVAGMYVSEVAEPSVRGTLGAFFQLQITVGMLLGFVLGLLRNPVHLAYVNIALPVVYAALFWSMPESPVFLLSRGLSERARASLQWLRGPEYDVSEEMAAMRHSIMESAQTKSGVRDLFKSRVAIKGMVVALGLMAAQQLSGVNAVIAYASDIFKASGSSMDPDQCNIIMGVVQVASTFLSMVLADRAGRRVLLLLSSGVMTICLATLGTYFHLANVHPDGMQVITWLPLVAVAVFITAFSLGLGPLPWCVVSEVFSPSVKGAAASVACGANWLMAFFVTKFFTNLASAFGKSGTFFVFTFIAAVGTLFIALVVPETKGKTLDEILAELTGSRVRSRPADGVPAAIEEEEEADFVRKPFPL